MAKNTDSLQMSFEVAPYHGPLGRQAGRNTHFPSFSAATPLFFHSPLSSSIPITATHATTSRYRDRAGDRLGLSLHFSRPGTAAEAQRVPRASFPRTRPRSARSAARPGELSYLRGLKVAPSCSLACLGADLPAVKSCDDGMS